MPDAMGELASSQSGERNATLAEGNEHECAQQRDKLPWLAQRQRRRCGSSPPQIPRREAGRAGRTNERVTFSSWSCAPSLGRLQYVDLNLSWSAAIFR